jgi:disulfide oxidoreductase YuzD
VVQGGNQIKTRKHLSASGLIQTMRSGFEKITDHRADNTKISLSDALMSGFAMYALKDASLLEFDKRRAKDSNLRHIYGLENIPSDSQMRTILDPVQPLDLRPLYQDVFRDLQRGKVLEKMVFMNGYYLLSLDGSGYFSSQQVHCASCLEKKNSKTGQITYHHQLLGGAIVHPDFKEVIPLAPEPIIKQDGQTKNDCERNAAKRFLAQFRQDHPHLPVIVIEDALSANAPHIKELEKHNLRYILGVKEGDHAFLFDYVETAHQAGQTTEYKRTLAGITHRFRFINQVPLNASNPDVLVNFIEYWEIDGDTIRHFCWITDLILTKANVFQIMRGGRARWKIENETFNTLKNQGYHFEHNYGHGEQNLSVVFAMLMMLAFLVDQTQQLACALFQAVLKKEGSRKTLWDHIRALFYTLEFASLEDIFRALLYGYKVEGLVILGPT